MAIEKREIHDRIYKFALSVLQSVKFIPKTTENLVLIKQVVRSSSSIGANALEADGSESKKEFIHRFTISKKEAKETFYWLSLISDHNIDLKSKFTHLLDENNQLILIISKIIINSKKRKI
jgi:four helix bundle protein